MSRHSTMTAKVKAYLAYRRGLGYQLKAEGWMLNQFAKFTDNRGHRGPITTELALRWARATTSTNRLYWARRLEVVRCLARHLASTEPGTEIPLRGLLGSAHRRTPPYLYTKADIARLMKGAGRLSPVEGLRPQTYRTLIGLLAASGLRIAEALNLSRCNTDMERGVLIICETKFHKSRLVPLHSTVIAALKSYAKLRDRIMPHSKSEQFFVNNRGLRLPYSTVRTVFRQLCNGLRIKGSHRQPRLHELRHTFACRRLETWSDAGIDMGHAIAALSTYLGHARVSDTYWYLTATPELMARVAAKFEENAPSSRLEVRS